ncbi:MAG: HugZ family protein [Caldithrix sp.]|nr:MAG: HugZ family protein [Caldithrix sp.]
MNQFTGIPQEARSLLASQYFGVLSTISDKVAGYPFGSVVPYSLNRNGEPVILISDIAEHTKNIVADPRVSLTVLEHGVEDVQGSARLTLLADAAKIAANDTGDRYYRRFPQSKDYHRTHNFDFYCLASVTIRYIGGFGKIHWLEPEQLFLANPFNEAEEAGIIGHMNEDHQSAMRYYLSHFKEKRVAEDQTVLMTGIDAEGFDLMLQGRPYRFQFKEAISTVQEAREILVSMAKA